MVDYIDKYVYGRLYWWICVWKPSSWETKETGKYSTAADNTGRAWFDSFTSHLTPSTPTFFISYLPTPHTSPALFLPFSFPDFPSHLSQYLLPSLPILTFLLFPIPLIFSYPSLYILLPSHASFLPLFHRSLNFLPTVSPLPLPTYPFSYLST